MVTEKEELRHPSKVRDPAISSLRSTALFGGPVPNLAQAIKAEGPPGSLLGKNPYSLTYIP